MCEDDIFPCLALGDCQVVEIVEGLRIYVYVKDIFEHLLDILEQYSTHRIRSNHDGFFKELVHLMSELLFTTLE